MALKDTWIDLQDAIEGIAGSGSDLTVEPINDIAHAVIELEDKEIEITIDTEMSSTSENPVQNKVIKSYVDDKIGDIGIALDELHNYAQTLVSGGGA